MIKSILFVCHGNICRSPMAEYIFKYISKNKYIVESRATSNEEIGNNIYPEIKKVLDKKNIPYTHHKAKKITIEDYNRFDLIICFDEKNIYNINKIIPNNKKTIKLLEKDIEDPWYTRDFEKTYNEIYQGCINLLDKIKNG